MSTAPATYVRLTSFSGQSPYRDASLGVSIDNEFNAVQVAINAVEARLALIQRDDGNLLNGSVGPDQLGSGLTSQNISSLTLLGINATNVSPNILTVGGASALFMSAGASGTNTDCKLRISKAAPSNIASILLQDALSSRAEIGLTGDDNLHFKVSADGTTFVDALGINTAGIVTTINPVATDNSARLATTSFVAGNFAPKLNPTFTGTLTAPAITINAANATLLTVGNGASGASATPSLLAFDQTFSSTAGLGPKLSLTAGYGFGVSANSLDYMVPTGGSHTLYVNGVSVVAHAGASTLFKQPVTMNLGLTVTGAAVLNSSLTLSGAGTFNSSLSINGAVTYGAPGLVGDGATVNDTNFQAALTALASTGGTIQLPAGVFKLTSAMTINLAAGKNFCLQGSGQSLTILFFSGAGGLVVNYADNFASVNIINLSVTTDTVGTLTAIKLAAASSNANPAVGGFSVLQNISIQGSVLATKYFSIGVDQNNVSNVNYVNISITGKTGGAYSTFGTGVNCVGLPGSSTYGVVSNFIGCIFNSLNIGALYGAFYQGMAISGGTNFTGCTTGVSVPASTGIAAQLTVIGNQFNCTTGINMAKSCPGTTIIGNTVLVPSTGVGIVLAGSNALISGNGIAALVAGNAIGIHCVFLTGEFGNVISGNSIISFAWGIQIDASCQPTIVGNANQNSALAINSASTVARIADWTSGLTNATFTFNVPVAMRVYTIAQLNALTGPASGWTAYVKDAAGTAPTSHMQVVAGAVAVEAPVYWDSTAAQWKWT